MSIFSKASDLVRANLFDLLNDAEDPEKMLNLYLEDAREGLKESREALHAAVTSEKELQGQWDEAADDQRRWASRAETAAKSQAANRTELVQEAVNKRRAAETRLANLKEPLSKAKADSASLRTRIETLDSKIEEAEHNRTSLVARAKAAKGRKKVSNALSKVQSADPTSVVSSVEDKVRRMEAEADASDELMHSHRQDLEDQFTALESSEANGGSSVDDEVAALLAKHAKPAASTTAAS